MAMGLTLELMARDRRPLSRIVADLPRYHIVKDKVVCSADQAPAALRTLREHYASQRVSRLDGLRVDFTRSWLLVRPSNTEPIIRFTAEAPGVDEAQALIAEAKRIVERKT
jgi:phosphomannomutase